MPRKARMFPLDCFAPVDFLFISIRFAINQRLSLLERITRDTITCAPKYRGIYVTFRVSEVGEGNRTFVQKHPINFMLQQSFVREARCID